MTSPEIEVRDRLAEALWRVYFAHGPEDYRFASQVQVYDCGREADDLLASLPTVGLILMAEDTPPTRQDDGGGE